MDTCKIVFTDVDGTLLNKNHEITPLTQQAIKKLEEKQIPFVIVSGRGPTGIYPILKDYGFNCPIIACNGGLILDADRQMLYHEGMSKTEAENIIQYLEAEHFDLSWCAYSKEVWIVKDPSDARIIEEARKLKAEPVKGEICHLEGEKINKLMCICNPEHILDIEEKLKKRFPSFAIAKSTDTLLEIMKNGMSKAVAVETLCKLWNIDRQSAVAFGDNYNDAEMLQAAGYGYLMENAPEELKKQFAHITADNNHDGIYLALKELGVI